MCFSKCLCTTEFIIVIVVAVINLNSFVLYYIFLDGHSVALQLHYLVTPYSFVLNSIATAFPPMIYIQGNFHIF